MKKYVEKGDLLKSNPIDGYWVCSIVLSNRDKTDEFNALSHIAVTNVVFDYDFSISEIDEQKIKIVHFKNLEGCVVPCIELYGTTLVEGIEVIGQVQAELYYANSLNFEIGQGHDGGWPLCGPLTKLVGFQAVHQWRSINDRDAWLQDIQDGEELSVTEMDALLRK